MFFEITNSSLEKCVKKIADSIIHFTQISFKTPSEAVYTRNFFSDCMSDSV